VWELQAPCCRRSAFGALGGYVKVLLAEGRACFVLVLYWWTRCCILQLFQAGVTLCCVFALSLRS
jgi:hypothetical protein